MSRSPGRLIAIALLLVVLLVAFFNFTEVDIFLRRVLQAVVPQQVQDAVRPLRAPMVIGFSPSWEAADVPLRSPVTISFLTPMNPEATEDNVTFEPAVAGAFGWRGSTLVFTPRDEWPMQTEVTVTVGRDARSWLLRRMERGFAFSFTTLGPPVVVATEPPQGVRYVYLQDRVTVRFNRPMDPESVERRLSIRPEIPDQRFTWREDQLTISGDLQPSTEYRIVIGQGARDARYGLQTMEDFAWSFVTTERPPYLVIGGAGKEVLVTAHVSSTLALRMANVSRVDVDLYAIDVPTYITMTNFSSDDWRQFGSGQMPLRSWSMDPQTTLDRDERRDLELEALEPGLYYLTLGSPEGAGDSEILVSSGTALTLKRTPTQALVWATSMGQGRPAPDLPLTLYDQQGRVLATGVTDEEGLFVGDLAEPAQRLYVVAGGEEELGVCSERWNEGIEPWRFETVLWRWEAIPGMHRVFLYTDRPTYRPGEQVNFRGVFRVYEYAGYTVPEPGTMAEVTAANPHGDVIYQGDLQISPFGTVYGAFGLDEEVEEGKYVLKAVVGGEAHQTTFTVDWYEAEPFRAACSLERDVYLTGEIISATVAASYDFGVAVREATVDYTIYASECRAGVQGDAAEATPCELPSYSDYTREVAVGHGVTDGRGEFQVALRAEGGAPGERQVFTLEATVTDDAGDQAIATARVLVHGGEFYIDLAPERLAVVRGERAEVRVRTTDTMGSPHPDLDLSYAIQVSEWERVPQDAQGASYPSWRQIITEVERSRIITDGEGRATISFTPQQGGVYRVEVWGRDGKGRRILRAAELWVADPHRRVAWRYSEHDRISLIPDQESYSPWETARVLVQSPYQRAMGLVTVEGAGILSYELVELRGNSAMLEVPVKPEYAPNVFVSVALVPQDVGVGTYGGFKIGYAEIEVRSTENHLQISLNPDRRVYEPGEMASFTIGTRDYLGRPVSAQVSLGVVDAAAVSAGEKDRLDLVEAFYGRRALAARTAQSLAVHADRERLVEDYGGAGGVGEQQPQGALWDVAYWNPAIVTDQQGLARVSFQVPADLTTWKVMASGLTADGLMGAADSEVSAYKPLVLRASAPSFLYVGDRAVIRAFLEDATGEPMAVQVVMNTTGGLSVTEGARTANLEAGGRGTLDWTVEAEEAGWATLTVLASAEEERREVVQRSVAILPFGEQTRVMEARVVEAEGSQTVSVPEGAASATLEVDVAPSLAAALLGSVESLVELRASSVEQTVSQFLPGLLVNQVLAEQGTQGQEAPSESSTLVMGSLQRLYRLQNRDGGWGWVEGGESRSHQTAYVVLGLKEAQNAGYPVNERVLEGGLACLRKVSVETRDLNEKAYLTYVLSACGEGDLSLARSLSERRRRMGLYAQAYLSVALSALGDQASARQVADDLVAQVVETAHTAHWREEEHDLAAMSSDGRTTAAVVRALLATDADNPLLAKAVRWLMGERQGGLWHSTYETSEIVRALATYLDVGGEAEVGTGYQVYLDEELLVDGRLAPDEMGAPGGQVTRELVPGEHVIKVVGAGAGPLYVSTVLEHRATRDVVDAARSLGGPRIERRYEAVAGGEPVERCAVGDLIRVRLLVEFPDQAWYVALADPVPPGTELVRISPLVTRPGETRDAGLSAKGTGFEQGVVFFTDWLPAGSYEYSYLVRAATPGEFRVMPAQAALVYDPGLWGRSSSGLLGVTGQP